MKKIEFLITVTSPPAQVGTKGEIKDVDDHVAKILIKGNYAVEVEPAAKKVVEK